MGKMCFKNMKVVENKRQVCSSLVHMYKELHFMIHVPPHPMHPQTAKYLQPALLIRMQGNTLGMYNRKETDGINGWYEE